MQKEMKKESTMCERHSIISFAIMLLMLAQVCVVPASAQRKFSDKDIIGVWIMESMQYEGEEKIILGTKYSQAKYYGPTGEYAAAEIVMPKKGKYAILPHEYGTYTFRKGQYTEMGRKGEFVLTSKTTARGKWNKCIQMWRKVRIPESLRQEIVLRCKASRPLPTETQNLIHKYILNKQ